MEKQWFKNSYVGLKLKELKHRLTYTYKSSKMVEARKLYKTSNNKKPLSQIRKEKAICKKYWRCYPHHYIRYELYKKDKILTKDELISYIPEFFFYSVFLAYYDTDKYSILIGDKNIMEQLFRSVGINQSITICKLIDGRIYTSDLKEIDFNKVSDELIKNPCEKIFIKPTDGEGGNGIIVFHLSSNNKYLNNKGEEFNETFMANIGLKNNYIIQKGIIQDESLSKIYGNSVNTFRIATENIGGKIRVICSVLRMGREGKEVDNASQDGIIVAIDDQGKCIDFATTEGNKIFYKHPDTNFIFKDYKIENWDTVKNFTIQCAGKLPQFTYLGWDIALGKDGPLAIETNLGFGIDLFQIPMGGLKEAFNIAQPKKYWKKYI